jgi:hypothetical protein
MTGAVTASRTKPFWEATVTGPMHIGWGQLGQKKPYVKKRKLTKKEQSGLDKRHYAVDVELERRGA